MLNLIKYPFNKAYIANFEANEIRRFERRYWFVVLFYAALISGIIFGIYSHNTPRDDWQLRGSLEICQDRYSFDTCYEAGVR